MKKCIYWDDWGIGGRQDALVQCQNRKCGLFRQIIGRTDCRDCEWRVVEGSNGEIYTEKARLKSRGAGKNAPKLEKAHYRGREGHPGWSGVFT